MIVAAVTLRDFRSYAAADLSLEGGVVIVTGENGAGKTNLLEAVHLGTQGFSPRTRNESQLVRFGAPAARVALSVSHAGVEHELTARLGHGQAKTLEVDGSAASSGEWLRKAFPTLVFTPDRLSVIKGGPIVRRAYFDRVLARLQPARATLPGEYGVVIQQRNAALRRVQLGLAPREAIEPWTVRAAELAASLVAARQETIAALAPGFAALLGEFGLPHGALAYPATAPSRAELEARLETDLARGVTGIGPHRDDVVITAAARDLRSFGSQGQQRLALLALLLAEAALVPGSPLVLLDDVLSELDGRRRELLARHVAPLEQTIVTATHPSLFPGEPSQVVEVSPGQAR